MTTSPVTMPTMQAPSDHRTAARESTVTVRNESSVEVPVSAAAVAPWVSDLGRYPEWMPLVHEAVPDGEHLWRVELRARVGVFARSKRLRMHRTVAEGNRWVFERDEDDGRRHATWRLEVRLDPVDPGTRVTMTLSYEGSLWTGGILDRVLAAQIEAGKSGLVAVVGAG